MSETSNEGAGGVSVKGQDEERATVSWPKGTYGCCPQAMVDAVYAERWRERAIKAEALQRESDENFALWEAASAREAVLVEALRKIADPHSHPEVGILKAKAQAALARVVEVDPCTCSDPTCPRHRGFVRDGKGAWRRARVVEAEPAAVVVTPVAEAFVRREGQILTVDADENGLRLDMAEAKPDGRTDG